MSASAATFTAHGTEYTAASARARMAQLRAENAQYGESDGRVTEYNALVAASAPARAAAAAGGRDPRPYVVLTRSYDANGKCRKGRRTFATAAAQSRFMATTSAAVTYYTH